MKTPLTRVEFWQLHKRIFEQCFGHDFAEQYKINPRVTKLYGFNKDGRDFPRSIRRIVDPTGIYQHFNTKLLHELRRAYDEDQATRLEITENLLGILLDFLEIDFEELAVKEEPPKRIKPYGAPSRRMHYSDEYNIRFSSFKNSFWYLYNKDRDGNDGEKIFRSVLEIQDEQPGRSGNLKVFLSTPGDRVFSNFTGEVIKAYSSPDILHIILHTTPTESSRPTKFRYIILRIERTGKVDKRKELYVGQYLRYNSDHTINSCSVVAHHQREAGLRPDKLAILLNRSQDTEALILEFFQLITHKVVSPSGIFSPYDLRIEVERLNRLILPLKYDLYISAPVSALAKQPKALEALYDQIDKMKKDPILQELGIHAIFSKDKSKLYERTESHRQLRRELSMIRQSKRCLFIYPLRRQIKSSIDVLLGAAAYSGKYTFVIHQDTKFLPRIVQRETETIKLIEDLEIESFPQWLRDNWEEEFGG